MLTVFDDFGFDVDPLPLPPRFGVPGACLEFGSEGRGVSVWRTMSFFSRLCAERRETQVKKEKKKKNRGDFCYICTKAVR